MYTALVDFKKVTPDNRIAELTGVSYGTLSTVVRQSGLFEAGGVKPVLSYDYLDSVRHAWKLFTAFSLEQGAGMRNWVECWERFTAYVARQGADLFKAAVASVGQVSKPQAVEGISGQCEVFASPRGEFRLFRNGVITGDDGSCTHAIVVMLNGSQGVKALLC